MSERFVLRGDDAPALNSARLGLTFSYLHAFTQSTTPTPLGNNFYQSRQPVDQMLPAFPDPQLTGLTIVHDTLYAILDTGLQLTPKLGLTLDAVWINQWHYPVTPISATRTTTG